MSYGAATNVWLITVLVLYADRHGPNTPSSQVPDLCQE